MNNIKLIVKIINTLILLIAIALFGLAIWCFFWQSDVLGVILGIGFIIVAIDLLRTVLGSWKTIK